MIGRSIGQYRILEEIAEGGMGTVYLAEDTTLDRRVAFKSVSRRFERDEQAHERFIREAKAASSLNHQNIVTVYEFVEDEGDRFICMEYVDGRTLRELVESDEISEKDAVEIILQVASALKAAHEQGILHRDIKSSNIMIRADGHVKVMDFGVAYIEKFEQMTQTGVMVGTLGCASPEQVGGRDLDQRSEIYSLGVVLYEILTGRLPLLGSSDAETVLAIIDREPEPVTKFRPDVSDDLDSIVMRMLSKDPDRRHQTCSELISDMEAILAESFVPTHPSTAHFRPRRIKARPLLIPLLVTIIIIGVIGIAIKQINLSSAPQTIRLAVLPLETSSSTDEIGTVSSPDEIWRSESICEDLRAIFRDHERLEISPQSSSNRYRDSDKSPRRFGRQINADYVVAGNVQMEPAIQDQARITLSLELIRVSNNDQVWAQIVTEDDSELVRLIADAADSVITRLNLPVPSSGFKSSLSDNLEARQYYSMGNITLSRGWYRESLTEAQSMYESAVNLDSSFAHAWAKLGRVHAAMYWFGIDRTEERRQKAKDAVDTAYSIAPDLTVVLEAMGIYHYWGWRDYARALELLERALLAEPKNSDLLYVIASVQRRQGDFQTAMENYSLAANLDPASALLAFECGITRMLRGEYKLAERSIDRAIRIEPASPQAHNYKVQLHLLQTGNITAAARTLRECLQLTNAWDVLFPSGLEGAHWATVRILAGEILALKEIIPKVDGKISKTFYMANALANHHLGREQQAIAYFDSARTFLEKESRLRPQDAWLHSCLGMAYAGLGMHDDAHISGTIGTSMLPITNDAFSGPSLRLTLAEIYMMLGDSEASLDNLEVVLSSSHIISVPLLNIDPLWDPVRDEPRFQQLLKQYSKQ